MPLMRKKQIDPYESEASLISIASSSQLRLPSDTVIACLETDMPIYALSLHPLM